MCYHDDEDDDLSAPRGIARAVYWSIVGYVAIVVVAFLIWKVL